MPAALRPPASVLAVPLFLTLLAHPACAPFAPEASPGVPGERRGALGGARVELLKDIHPGTALAWGWGPEELTVVGETLYFRGASEASGEELWRSDGTPEGTRLVRDIQPAGNGRPQWLTGVAGTLYFLASDGSETTQLWRSDGTREGTRRIFSGSPPSSYFHASNLTAVGTRLFFTGYVQVAGNPTPPRGLWVSDGTPEGTRPLDVAGLELPSQLTAMGDTLYFTAGGSLGTKLWKSDGTAKGTTLAKDLCPGWCGVHPEELTVAGGLLYFTAYGTSPARELWRTDGTPEGTVRLGDLSPGLGNDAGAQLTPVGRTLYFIATGPDEVTGLWRTDGTPESTRPVWARKDALPGFLEPFQDGVAFVAAPPADGLGLYVSDGQGTRRVRTLDGAGYVKDVAASSGLVYVLEQAPDPAFTHLWRSDGTAEGTFQVVVPPVGRYAGDSVRLVPYRGGVAFPGRARHNEAQLWWSDGTPAGARRLTDAFRAAGSDPMVLGRVGDTLLLRAWDDAHGSELWRTDGTPEGTSLVLDAVPGQAGSAPYFRGTVDGALVLLVHEAETGSRLWRSDATAEGTAPIDPAHALRPQLIGGAATHRGVSYFGFDDGVHGYEPWRTDGTAEGTFLLKDLRVGADTASPDFFQAAGGLVFFQAYAPDGARDVWRTDGTSEGTFPLRPLGERGFTVLNEPFAVLGSRVFFAGSGEDSGEELWTTDGTVEGTRRLADLCAARCSSHPRSLTPVGDALLFYARDGVHFRVARTDGTPEGTFFLPGSHPLSGARLETLVRAGDTLFFYARDERTGEELWRSDGTPEGTWRVRDIFPGPDSGVSDRPVAVGRFVVFPGNDGVSGVEPWVSDGTEAGTFRAADIGPGQEGSFPMGFVRLGERIIFSALGPKTGREPWSLTLPGLPPEPRAPDVQCPSDVTVEAGDASGAVVAWPEARVVRASTGDVTLWYSHRSGARFGVGRTRVVTVATDAEGREGFCRFFVTVTERPAADTTPPRITCPEDVHVTTGEPLGARVDFTPATAEDTGSAVTVSYHPAGPGSRFPSGRTEVRAEAVDASGNTASCTFTVSVSLPDAPSDRPVVPEVPAPAGATRSTFGCSASPASAALPWAALLLLAALRRRSRAYRG